MVTPASNDQVNLPINDKWSVIPNSDYASDLDKIWQKPTWSNSDIDFVLSAKTGPTIENEAFESNGLLSKSGFNEALMSDPVVSEMLDQTYEKVVDSSMDFDLARQMLEKSYSTPQID